MTRTDVKPTSRTNAKAANKAGDRKPPTFDHLRKKKPLEIRLPVPLDSDLLDRVQEAEEALERAKLRREPTELRESELDQLRAELEDNTVIMVFRSPGRPKYEELINSNPPTEEQQKEHREEHGVDAPYNPETFAPALIAACCVEPKMTPEEVSVLIDGEYDEDGNEITPAWNMNEIMPLFTSSLAVCNANRIGEQGKGFGSTPGSRKN